MKLHHPHVGKDLTSLVGRTIAPLRSAWDDSIATFGQPAHIKLEARALRSYIRGAPSGVGGIGRNRNFHFIWAEIEESRMHGEWRAGPDDPWCMPRLAFPGFVDHGGNSLAITTHGISFGAPTKQTVRSRQDSYTVAEEFHLVALPLRTAVEWVNNGLSRADIDKTLADSAWLSFASRLHQQATPWNTNTSIESLYITHPVYSSNLHLPHPTDIELYKSVDRVRSSPTLPATTLVVIRKGEIDDSIDLGKATVVLLEGKVKRPPKCGAFCGPEH